ncbi:hypothetical protein RhiirA4_419410 [Rhizophagus irregularis]|uniref:Uncharacterized protein n=1 Tax=Rhizophagus irregularis TaxID=588596 RepID=A0A2I1GE48_9GLOM|nr:hypothetical protein RhiirA4_419410 [Rhizophagus irregularis]
MDIWNIRDFEDIEDLTFNFVDMIKGIIPMSLTSFIKKYKIQGCEIISIYEKIFTFLLENSTNSIWIPRCVELNSLEKELGLTRQMKINSRYGEYSKKFDHNSQGSSVSSIVDVTSYMWHEEERGGTTELATPILWRRF